MLRALAVQLNKTGIDFREFAWLVRVKNIWKDLGASEEDVENILTYLPVWCYKRRSAKHFVNTLVKYREFCEIHGDDPIYWSRVINWYEEQLEIYKRQLHSQAIP